MNRVFIAIGSTFILCSIAFGGLASERAGAGQDEPPRFATACPSVSADSRTRIEKEISGVLGDQLRRYHGGDALPLNTSLEPLVDSEHRKACEYLTRVYKNLINKTYQRSEGSQPSYEYSVAYFEAGSFYFVLIDIHPDQLVSSDPRFDRVVISSATGPRVHLKENMERVSDQKGFVYGPKYQKLVNDRIRERLEGH
ncbi:hypothetical protein G4Y73_10165 [Wenzhouxiangella sp. XN201]|uniref:hypothetical protein n=1 Tax=Wenzhouxiangella sp. XN201 TaxID=2710755 RepID=UPI0013C71505|nr:hypothetical protein [Wenzhouxiangella sp. XN201]NEZ04512.1 hypothetical protein [Wenzhouxiangella sp. XN201]